MLTRFSTVSASASPSSLPPAIERRRAARTRARLLKQTPLIDGHNDYPWALREKAQRNFEKLEHRKAPAVDHDRHPRLRAGGVGGQFWSVYVPVDLVASPVTATLEKSTPFTRWFGGIRRRSSSL